MWKFVTKLLFIQGFVATSIGLYFVTQAQPVKLMERGTGYGTDSSREIIDSSITTREGTLIAIGLLLMLPMLIEVVFKEGEADAERRKRRETLIEGLTK